MSCAADGIALPTASPGDLERHHANVSGMFSWTASCSGEWGTSRGMVFKEIALPVAFVIELEPHGDERGMFARNCEAVTRSTDWDTASDDQQEENRGSRGRRRVRRRTRE